MSINVTVSGNPISIKRGKMVTIDSNSSKEEFDKRRLMRLEQVRQQSKDIAGNIRNKVHKEKMKQMKKIEKEGKEKLKEWKNMKLLELQSQYKEALDELGTAHKEAQNVNEELDDFEKEQLDKRLLSLQRGQEAIIKLQTEKNQEYLKKSFPLQKKKAVRDIENTRAHVVSNMKKIKEKHKTKSQLNIGSPLLISSSEIDKLSVQDQKNTIQSYGPTSQEYTENLELSKNHIGENEIIENMKEFQDSTIQKNSFHREDTLFSIDLPLNTRISDRIKMREPQGSKPDFCDTLMEKDQAPYVASNTKVRESINSRLYSTGSENVPPSRMTDIRCKCCCRISEGPYRTDDVLMNQNPCHSCFGQKNVFSTDFSSGKYKKHDDSDVLKSEDETSGKWNVKQPTEIPVKPSVRIKDIPFESEELSEKSKKFNKVQYYDQSSKFLMERTIPSSSYVEKCSRESIEVLPNLVSEEEMIKRMNRRDKEAQVRGKKALMAERVRRDYEEMLKKLPLLQKKEKILELKKDKQEYHMPKDRLKEVERIRQNKLENAFNEMFPNIKPAVVTLPKVNKEPEKEIIDKRIEESIQSLDLNKLDTTDKETKMFSTAEVQEIVRAFTQQKPSDRRAKLKELLNSLKLQKDELIKEIQAMPHSQNESVAELINDLNSFDDGGHFLIKTSKKKDVEKPNRKRRHKEHDLITESVESSSSSSTGEQDEHKQKNGNTRYKVHRKSTSNHQKKKSRNKPKIIILQNTSTQTTPVSKGQNNTVQEKSEFEQPKALTEHAKPSREICKKQHIPCDCNIVENPKELCRILISLDDDKSAVIIDSDKNAKEEPKRVQLKSVGVGTEKIKKSPSHDVNNQIEKPTRDTLQKKLRQMENLRHESIEKKSNTENQAKASWREHLSKNSNTSSTSYMSPPDVLKPISISKLSSKNKDSFYYLRDKPQQKNLSSTIISSVNKMSFHDSENTNLQLVAFVEKLLGMSRASIDVLNASSTSSVATPSQSLIDIESNNPTNLQFQELLKQLTLKIGNVEGRSYSPDNNKPHFNTSISTSEEFQIPTVTNKNKIDQADGVIGDKSKETISQQYAEITDSCSKRIASLAAMIQQIRKEKIEMIQNPLSLEDQVKARSPVFSDKEFSTVYMDLPDLKDAKHNQKSLSSSSSSSSLNTDDEEILKKLLEVDLNLAKKLRNINRPKDGIENDNSKHITAEFEKRLESLLQPDPKSSHQITTQKGQPFVSFLSDIPKLPKFEPAINNNVSMNNHKRPPPSKGLTIAKKFNENISLVPHELSTIVEADSQLSNKMVNGLTSPNSDSSKSLSPLKDVELFLPQASTEPIQQLCSKMFCDINKARPIEPLSTTNGKNEMYPPNSTSSHSKSGSCEISCERISHNLLDSSKHTSSSSDDIETIEAMLKSIGMEWAIPTLHKTKEALALSSSSSSLELSQKNKLFGNDSSTSDINLKAFLSKQLYKKLSSSTLISDTSPVSILGEISVFSDNHSHPKERQRTSTPLTSKNSSKSKEGAAFSMESDISSVNNVTT